ncbi:hypothetical protein HXX76_007604 [Chlamydomonas incerta]|uniref:Bidirectional sugar transporter SWEET n=1 Tax=Chlamydomonas incerta TaxID=51695 RepID=A0A835W2J4_CHLIN|nr:hypothetical protein HXX76_007604 [Chlamydomonas incerta]|eukprot:KAG2434714.1 hypothetical protein HXX76_007604 [Chlamydomonas incerta]
MLLSPFPAVLRLRAAGRLGDTNPLPYPMTVVNAAGWVAYGYATANPYIFPANVVGFLAGVFFTFTAFACATKQVQDRITAIMVAASAHYILLGLIGCFALSPAEATRMWGTSAVVILMLYYFVPLSTMVQIVRTRNAASIYPPLAVTAIANGLMWTIYGFAVMDINLWLPNLFGSVIGVIQLLLRLMYGAKPTGSAAAVAGGGSLAAGAGATAEDEETAAFAKTGVEPSGAAGQDRPHSGTRLLGASGVGLSCEISAAAAAVNGADRSVDCRIAGNGSGDGGGGSSSRFGSSGTGGGGTSGSSSSAFDGVVSRGPMAPPCMAPELEPAGDQEGGAAMAENGAGTAQQAAAADGRMGGGASGSASGGG